MNWRCVDAGRQECAENSKVIVDRDRPLLRDRVESDRLPFFRVEPNEVKPLIYNMAIRHNVRKPYTRMSGIHSDEETRSAARDSSPGVVVRTV